MAKSTIEIEVKLNDFQDIKEEIKNLLHEFWNSSSDACPLEATEQENQERLFSEWVESKFKDLGA